MTNPNLPHGSSFRAGGRWLAGLAAVAVLAGPALGAEASLAPQDPMRLAQAEHEHGRKGPPAPTEPETVTAPPMPGMAGMSDMPHMPGMQHGPGAPTGHDMSPVDVTGAALAAPDTRGGQLLQPTVRDGAKEFALTTGVVQWSILPDVEVGAYAYNGQVPGPTIRAKPGDRVRIKVTNALRFPTTVHWHGMILPVEQDGVPELSQPPIPPGAEHVYEFTVANAPGTYFYHSHYNADRQQPLGLYGALIIDGPPPVPEVASEAIVMLGEWTVIGGGTYPAMPFGDMLPNYFTINGKSYPATETVRAKVGDRILFRLIGSGQFIHPIHIHGGPFQIVATDGNPVPEAARSTKDTVLVGPGERYDVVWTAHNPGRWLLHCHINHHMTNNGAEAEGAGGMAMIIDVSG